MRLRLNVLVLIVLLVFVPETTFCGWWIVERSEDRYGNFSSQSIFIQGQKLRVESATSSFIFDLENEEVCLVFPKQTIYWKGNGDTLRNRFLLNIEHQMRMMIEQIPQYEREKALPELEKMLSDLKAGDIDTAMIQKISFKAVDSTSSICGFPSSKFQVVFDTTVIEETWISSEIMPYSGISLKKLNKMMRLFSRPTVFAAVRESDGWTHLMQGGLMTKSIVYTSLGRNTTQVTQVKEVNVRDEFFIPPPDYRAVSADEVVGIMLGENIGMPELKSRENTDEWKPILPTIPKKTDAYQMPVSNPPELPD